MKINNLYFFSLVFLVLSLTTLYTYKSQKKVIEKGEKAKAYIIDKYCDHSRLQSSIKMYLKNKEFVELIDDQRCDSINIGDTINVLILDNNKIVFSKLSENVKYRGWVFGLIAIAFAIIPSTYNFFKK